jgi:hypothetical protein
MTAPIFSARRASRPSICHNCNGPIPIGTVAAIASVEKGSAANKVVLCGDCLASLGPDYQALVSAFGQGV